jgi:hypothetical protein
MEETATKKDTHIIPPKKHVYLDGPKSRGYELLFAWRVFRHYILQGPALPFSALQGLRRSILIISKQENLENVLLNLVLQL